MTDFIHYLLKKLFNSLLKGVTTVKNFLTVLTAVALFGLVACEGPAGPAGKDGAAGATGAAGKDAGFTYFEGYKADLKCATCHSADSDTSLRVAAMKFQYEFSKHGEGAEYSHTSNTCNGCHTNEGFNERYRKGFATETFTLGVASGPITSQAITDVTRPGCFTCHAPHARGNFSVRDTGGVNIFTLIAGKNTAVWNSTNESNLCVKCHQPRMTSNFLIPGSTTTSWQPNAAKTAATDTAKIYTTSWNNHVSGQMTQTLLGTGGVEIPGNLPYSNSYHTTLVGSKTLGCPDCHMATVSSGTRYGGHTFAVRYVADLPSTSAPSYNLTGCNVTGCHTGVTTTEAHWTKRATIIAKIAELGKLMMDTTITKKWSLPQSGKAVAWVKVTPSTVNAFDSSWSGNGASSTVPLVIVPAFKAGALWNLVHVQNDKSHGMHNYQYTLALLQNSIDELKK
jgi:hypothetical protein